MESTFKIDDFDNLLSDLQASLTPLTMTDTVKPAQPTTNPTASTQQPQININVTVSAPPPSQTQPQTQVKPPAPSISSGSDNKGSGDNSAPRRGRGRNSTVSNRRESRLIKPDPAILASKGPNNCAKCHQPLTGSYIMALEKHWHPEHFSCDICRKPLDGAFFETDTGIVCEGCASSIYKCAECGGAITGQHLIYEDGRTVHTTCVPKKPCARCHQLMGLNESHIEALDMYWHPEHFTCTKCHTKLGTSFIQMEGQPYCQSCIEVLQKERKIVINNK